MCSDLSPPTTVCAGPHTRIRAVTAAPRPTIRRAYDIRFVRFFSYLLLLRVRVYVH